MTTPGQWRDLSSSELAGKLRQRGLNEPSVLNLVHHREDPRVVEALDRILGVGES